MALKGSISKEIVTKKILETFEGSFQEIRIPMEEDGNQIQLKCVLTCAKTNVEPNGENAIPGEVTPTAAGIPASEKTFVEPTQEEKDNVQKLMQMLNL